MLARHISVRGALFLIFLLGLYVAFNVPVENALRKMLKGHDKLVAFLELCFYLIILIVARIMAGWVAPSVTASIQRIVDFLIDMLTCLFQH